MLIDFELCRRERACYRPERLSALFPVPRTLLEVLTLQEGPWSEVPNDDRIWVATRPGLLDSTILREWLYRLTVRALTKAGLSVTDYAAPLNLIREGTGGLGDASDLTSLAAIEYGKKPLPCGAIYTTAFSLRAASDKGLINDAYDAAGYAVEVHSRCGIEQEQLEYANQITDLVTLLRSST